MNQQLFIQNGEPRWKVFEDLLRRIEHKKPINTENFPYLYRCICHDLALAQQRQFDTYLVDRLNQLALRGHHALYRPRPLLWKRVFNFWLFGFPQAVRLERYPVLLATGLFYSAAFSVLLAVSWRPELIYSIMSPWQVAAIEQMYDPQSEDHLRPRGVDTDAAMFGFYIRNNMSAGFRTFAGGIFAGVGSLFFLIYNAVFLGGLAGHLTLIGFGKTLFPFIVGHSSLELTALTFAAAAGLRMGWSLVAPGQYTRVDSLRMYTRRALPLVYGSTGMLLGAACIEAFWSSSHTIGSVIKYTVGFTLWITVVLYFLLGGTKVDN